jgi:hypothetical protein
MTAKTNNSKNSTAAETGNSKNWQRQKLNSGRN